MRAVLDTNVLVSSILTPRGPTGRLVEPAREGRPQLLVSPSILDELRRVLAYPRLRAIHQWTDQEILAFVDALAALAEETPGYVQVHLVSEDPEDDKFLACAREGSAQYIVSADPHLPDLEEHEGIRIVTVRDFLAILEMGGPPK